MTSSVLLERVCPPGLTTRWHPAVLHPKQMAYLNSMARLNLVAAGRRSFKTEAGKRRVVRSAIFHDRWPDAQFFACGPTHQQAKDIFWVDIKKLVPDWAFKVNRKRSISDGELRIDLANGACIRVAGLDKPQRIEGGFWDGGVITEFAECKEGLFDAHIRPMMMRGGWCDLESVPEGRNHFYTEVEFARNYQVSEPNGLEYAYYHWKVSEVLHLYLGKEAAQLELKRAKEKMDPRTYSQEYDAEFLNASGLVYYCFDRDVHCMRLEYNPKADLHIAFDFNRSPGVAAIAQEEDGGICNWIGEVHIPENSNTPAVARRVAADWGKHPGEVYLYGDPSGSARTTKSEDGLSDWDAIDKILRPVFGARLHRRVPRSHPRVNNRVNSVNSRLMNSLGDPRMFVDPRKCPNIVRDFEGVMLLKGGSGEIDKDKTPKLTHLTDAMGYYVWERWPSRPVNITESESM